ncbi:MAG: hypothetical protein RML95_15295 [Anaerolineae bacterium]|nr:hypothetical protein [Anaerolineae bacterium]
MSLQELLAWLAQHNAPKGAFGQLLHAWFGSEFAPERGLLVQKRGDALWLHHAQTGEQLASFYAESEIRTATFLQNGEVIALGCANGQVIFLRVAV